MGTRLCRLGSAKVVCPLPPYMVPSSENSAVFCEIDRSWPLHRAQPRGAKPKPNGWICPRNGCVMSSPYRLAVIEDTGGAVKKQSSRADCGHLSRFDGGHVDE